MGLTRFLVVAAFLLGSFSIRGLRGVAAWAHGEDALASRPSAPAPILQGVFPNLRPASIERLITKRPACALSEAARPFRLERPRGIEAAAADRSLLREPLLVRPAGPRAPPAS